MTKIRKITASLLVVFTILGTLFTLNYEAGTQSSEIAAPSSEFSSLRVDRIVLPPVH